MANSRPSVYLYDKATGKFLPVVPGSSVSDNVPGFFAMGSDGTYARYMKMTSDGTVAVSGNVHVLSSVLPNGAAQEHTTSTSPSSVRLSDGTSFVTVKNMELDKSLSIAMLQDVHTCSCNAYTGSLAVSASFTGTAESSLGVAGLQVNLKSDQNMRLLMQQSTDGTNWDISDEWLCDAARGGDSRTFQATAAYLRVILQNIGTATTTYINMQTALCPVVEVVPRALTQLGSFKVAIKEQQAYTDCIAGRLFSANVEAVVGTTEVPFVVFTNPTGSGKDVAIHKIILDCLSKGYQASLRVYAGTTLTSGSSVTILNRRQKPTFPTPASACKVYETPTVSVSGTRVVSLSVGTDANSLIDDVQSSLIIGPGRSILLSAQASNISTTVSAMLMWSEYT